MNASDRIGTALHSLTAPTSLRDRASALSAALRAACAVTGSPASAFTMIEGRHPMRHVLVDGHQLVSRAAPRVGDGIVRATVLEGRMMFVPRVSSDPRFLESDAPGELRVESCVTVPVVHRSQVVGVLACFNPSDQTVPDLSRVMPLLATATSLAMDNARLSQSLQRVAITDDLTQVYNYRFLRTALRREMKRSSRSRTPFTLLMVDVDHLKEYNDKFGHLRGSRVLRELARVLARRVRGMDLVAKYGGDEFTVILPETGRSGGQLVAERIRASVAAHQFPRVNPGDITVSVGIALFPEDGIQPATLIAASDAALYAAKQSGRNRVAEATGLTLRNLECA
ncbi:MAG TPA: sensor domain-containing diguanylate cyclase [Candidatus Eisenbacteria bacterium]|nr:sensor domain-containing diguanylate cyclase [Candidatus Eisenbacteria bacterium]